MTVHWTRFAARSRPDVNWSNPDKAHKAVMSMFSVNLPGDAEQKRAGSGILYRLDAVDGELVVTVQSLIEPVMLPVGARTMVLPESVWSAEKGQTVLFRLAVNPVRRVRGERSDPAVRPVSKEQAVPAEESPEWVTGRLGDALAVDEILNHTRDVYTVRRGKGSHKLVVDSFDGVATVTDPEAFDVLRLAGVGRAKAFGCGLLTAQVVR